MPGPKRGNPLDRFSARYTVTETGCWLWSGARYSNGYGRFYIGRQDYLAHRIAYQLLIGEIPVNLNVLHRCDVPSCVNPDHLFVGTQKENLIDAQKKDRLYGGQAKLTVEQVREIRNDKGSSLSYLSRKYGVRKNYIVRLKNGEGWQS